MLAPVVQIDDFIYGNVEAPRASRICCGTSRPPSPGPAGSDHDEEVTQNARGGRADLPVLELRRRRLARGARELKRDRQEPGAARAVKNVACTGISFQAPMVEIVQFNQGRHRYACVKPEEVRTLLLRHFEPVGWIKRAGSYASSRCWSSSSRTTRGSRRRASPRTCAIGNEQCYSGPQVRLVTEHSGILNPHSLDDYLAHDGFEALHGVPVSRRTTPKEVIEEVKQERPARARRRPASRRALKWELTRANGPGRDQKYVICNGDEGDPGAFMDRMILESFPFRVLEGMIIAAWAIGAEAGLPVHPRRVPARDGAHPRTRSRICEERGYLGSQHPRQRLLAAAPDRGGRRELSSAARKPR